jgi:hypothetical protein
MNAHDWITNNWPPHDSTIPITIPAAAPTNCMIWISSNQIRNIAYFPRARLIFLTIEGKYSNLSLKSILLEFGYYLMHQPIKVHSRFWSLNTGCQVVITMVCLGVQSLTMYMVSLRIPSVHWKVYPMLQGLQIICSLPPMTLNLLLSKK